MKILCAFYLFILCLYIYETLLNFKYKKIYPRKCLFCRHCIDDPRHTAAKGFGYCQKQCNMSTKLLSVNTYGKPTYYYKYIIPQTDFNSNDKAINCKYFEYNLYLKFKKN